MATWTLSVERDSNLTQLIFGSAFVPSAPLSRLTANSAAFFCGEVSTVAEKGNIKLDGAFS